MTARVCCACLAAPAIPGTTKCEACTPQPMKTSDTRTAEPRK